MADWPSGIIAGHSCISTTDVVNSVGAEINNSNSITQSAAWQVANTGVFVPVRVFQPITVVKMAIIVGATNTGSCDVGIYDPAGNRLVRAGSTALGTASTVQTFDITDTALDPGLYYFALALTSTSGTVFQSAPGNLYMRAMGCFTVASAFSTGLITPVTYASVNGTVTRFPWIGAYMETAI